MAFDTKILGISAFTSYFGLDALTTCAAILLYGMGAESNPAFIITLGSYGILGFLLLKLALTLALTLVGYILTTLPGTRFTGISALVAIAIGGLLAAINNTAALVTGTSLFYELFGKISFFNSGMIVAVVMLLSGLVTYMFLCLKRGNSTFRAPFHH